MMFPPKILVFVISQLSVACGPGMTIRQINSANASADRSVTVHVKTMHPLMGETWYAPGLDGH